MLFTVGIGFTVMEKVVGTPEQLFVKGTTVNWLVTGTKALVTAENGLIFPVPVALPIPMPMLLAVQRYWVPTTEDPEKMIGWLRVLAQST